VGQAQRPVGREPHAPDSDAFLALATTIPLSLHIETHPLSRANDARAKLRAGAIAGTAVLTPGG
jgi:D-arabinose 1-dehydrogenase-like Zn-dependent alcohol dehydrogenase